MERPHLCGGGSGEQGAESSLGRGIHESGLGHAGVTLQFDDRGDRHRPVDTVDAPGVVPGGDQVGLEGAHIVGHPLSRPGFVLDTTRIGEQTHPGHLQLIGSGGELDARVHNRGAVPDIAGIGEGLLRSLHGFDRLGIDELDLDPARRIRLHRLLEHLP